MQDVDRVLSDHVTWQYFIIHGLLTLGIILFNLLYLLLTLSAIDRGPSIMLNLEVAENDFLVWQWRFVLSYKAVDSVFIASVVAAAAVLVVLLVRLPLLNVSVLSLFVVF